MGSNDIPDPPRECYFEGVDTCESDFDLGDLRQDLGFVLWLPTEASQKKLCDEINTPGSGANFTYNPYPLYTYP
jgi:hypothetical protein